MQLPTWYTRPTTQVVLMGITCFATPGMYSALGNLGAGGTQNVSLADTSTGVLYGFFALAGLISGGITNMLGPRLTLFLGTLGYALYTGALWCYQTQGTRWFLIFSGAVLGVSAALLWSAQGAVMMSYPLEKDRGKSFAIFWAIFSFGSFIGSIIALAINIESGKLNAVSTSTYIAFLVIIFCGVASSLLILPPDRIVRGDGTLVTAQKHSSINTELIAMAQMFTDWRVVALIPMFFASNYFYAYQGAINFGLFDSPTRALNGTLEGVGAIVGALMIGCFVLDDPTSRIKFSRRTRGYIGLGVVVTITIVVWAVALSWQVTFDRADAARMHAEGTLINYHEGRYRGKAALLFFYYFSDACYQALAYWIMSAITNDPFRLARFAGIYKAIQSAGGAGSFGMDAVATPYFNELLASWILMLASFPLAFLVIRTVKESNYEDEQVVYVGDVKHGAVEAGELNSPPVEEEKASSSSIDA
ncbi:MFS general substrate transporter [Punctularia strigosozonata HHB-11173 SS5]|uniref:MFS general substrate transporter n=1 Tax=Punctularia strigosozonata (strain HHB-11173) TaxID=741275 RepID=UPI0004417ACE|nr:MFS general substrate transporter [Punctularia strigosozonata HHB-11173 SS5]EIN11279.1 MFS general substrate transporter [Punctularia strigosozonata HHB-11173 SS5]